MKKYLANYISAIRIIISPVIIYLLLVGSFELATLLYLLGLLTDVIDGYVARKLNTVSDFGMIWDPITSVILFYSASFTLAFLGCISWIYPLVIGIYSFLAFIIGNTTKYEKLKKSLHLADVVIGAGIGDIGLGLLMVYIFMPGLFIVITFLVFVILLLKLMLHKRAGSVNLL